MLKTRGKDVSYEQNSKTNYKAIYLPNLYFPGWRDDIFTVLAKEQGKLDYIIICNSRAAIFPPIFWQPYGY